MAISKVNYGKTTLIDLTGDTVTADKMIEGTTAHGANGEKVTGTIAVRSAADLKAEPNMADMYVHAVLPEGFYPAIDAPAIPFYSGTTTFIPTKEQQSLDTGMSILGDPIVVAPIPDKYITTTDATAKAEDIVSGKTAYVNGEKVTGIKTVQTFFAESTDPDASRMSEGDLWIKL